MEKPKRVVIKIHDNGAVEIIAQDPGVAIVLQYPDGCEAEVHANFPNYLPPLPLMSYQSCR